jgi:two-component system, NtrC family, response regulator GlrR
MASQEALLGKDVRVLLLDLNPSPSFGERLRDIFKSSSGHHITHRWESRAGEVISTDVSAILQEFNPDVVFLILSPEHARDFDALTRLVHGVLADVRIMIVLERADPDKIAELLKRGAIDFITPPLKSADVLARLLRLLVESPRNHVLESRLKEKFGLKNLVGESPSFLEEIRKIPLVAKGDAGVLISGETGTGKELCARAIHYLSRRSGKPFVVVNCGAIPLDLVENELFGHVQGAFTGATSSRYGLISQADGGTLFLDEIDCLPLPSQVKLLRFLQEKEYKRLGSPKTERADVRVIAATNTDLEQAVRDGRFRTDLYYRLNVVPLMLPPLRDRREDIPILARHFLRKYTFEMEKKISDFTTDAMRRLMFHDWPGNVRELENVVERAVIFARQEKIEVADIALSHSEPAKPCLASFKKAKAAVVEEFEKKYIQELLVASHGNITRAAQTAHKNRRAFWELIRRHGIDMQSFRQTAM